jgi:hypothetical protein
MNSHQILLVHNAEKIRLLHPLNFRGITKPLPGSGSNFKTVLQNQAFHDPHTECVAQG